MAPRQTIFDIEEWRDAGQDLAVVAIAEDEQ